MNRHFSYLLSGILLLGLTASNNTHAVAAARVPQLGATRHSLGARHPTTLYATYINSKGQAGDTQGIGVKVDNSGNIYVLGMTTASGAHRAIFVSKYDPSGTKLLYSTLLGGACDQQASGLALDRAGNAYVTGQYVSKNTYGTCTVRQALVAKLTPAGSIAYTVHLGHPDLSAADAGNAIAADGQGNAYVTGESNLDMGFPTTAGAFQRTCTVDCAFVAKVNSAGKLVYSTFLSGNDTAKGRAITVDGQGDAYVTGETTSVKFPTTSNAYQPAPGANVTDLTLGTVFVSKLNPTGSALLYSTYLTGQGGESSYAIALDANGRAYVTGQTSSVHFPTTQTAYSRTLRLAPGACGQAGGGLCSTHSDAFLAEIDPNPALPARRTLVYATYFGGTLNEIGAGIAVDQARHVYLTGATSSWNTLPTVAATQPRPGAGKNYLAATLDAFVAEFDLAKSGHASLVFSTYLGGSADDIGQDIALDHTGNVDVVGATTSRDFPLRAAAQQSMSGSRAGFLVRIHTEA